MGAIMTDTTEAQELAYYYPEPFWGDGDWIKNLLLFFDGVAVLVPDYMRERFEQYAGRVEFTPGHGTGFEIRGFLPTPAAA